MTCSIWPGSARTIPSSGAGRSSSSTWSPRSRCRRPPTSASTEFRSSGRGFSTCRRPNASSCFVSSAARSAARLISPRSRASSASPFVRSSSSDAYPMIPVRRLLKSCATPPASRPRLSSFWALRSSDSRRFRSVMSRMNAMCSPGTKFGRADASETTTAPSGRIVCHSSRTGPPSMYSAQLRPHVLEPRGGRNSSRCRPIRSRLETPISSQPAGLTST